jgi:hypothetical protein
MTLGVAKMTGVLPIGEMFWSEKLEDEYLSHLRRKLFPETFVSFFT